MSEKGAKQPEPWNEPQSTGRAPTAPEPAGDDLKQVAKGDAVRPKNEDLCTANPGIADASAG